MLGGATVDEYPAFPELTFDSICTSLFCSSLRLARIAASSEEMSPALLAEAATG